MSETNQFVDRDSGSPEGIDVPVTGDESLDAALDAVAGLDADPAGAVAPLRAAHEALSALLHAG